MPIRWHPHLPICRPDFQINGFRPIFHTAHIKDEPGWKRVMIAMQRKVIIICTDCHSQIHNGTLPSWMRNARSDGELDAPKGCAVWRIE
jgi:hypothetical protein